MIPKNAVMRIARPTDNLYAIGKTFEDIDGYRVVLQNQEWTS